MKKSNIIVYALLIICSAFLLFLWYYLGLFRIDEPLDLVLSVIWWVMIAAAIFAIIKIEQKRKERIRTVYVSKDDRIYNAETGIIPVSGTDQLLDTVSRVVKNLKYDFDRADAPNKQEFLPKYLIRTSKIKEETWEGEVVDTWSKKISEFKSKDELGVLITSMV